MAIKTFDTLSDMSEHFDSEIYRDIVTDSLLVQDVKNNIWHRYSWTPGKRELKFRETLLGGELPIMVQVYPKL
ncbi:MAG: hypothetical protein NT075_32185 [Chloroflexi bacterium]|nr:hypothetical protein [Chloroflexota bacterium]